MIYVASLKIDNDEIIKGNRCVTSPKELYECITEKDTTEIRILKEFFDEFFTPSGLADFIKNVNMLNSSIHIVTDFKWEKSEEVAVRQIRSLATVEEFIFALESQPKDTIDLLHMLCDSYLDVYNETLSANNKVSSLHMQNSRLIKEIEEAAVTNNRLMEDKLKAETKLHQLVSRINFSYGKNIDENTMFQIDGCRYDKVLYIKEITRVHYTDTFIYYLQEILKTLYGVPARILVIEPYYAYDRLRLYHGLKPHWNLRYQDVYESDIFMAGFQPKLARDIMQNSSAYNYLIILDRGGVKDPHIVNDKVEVLWTVSDMKDAPKGLDPTRIITYSGNHLIIDYVKDFDKLSAEAKISAYSSMPIMKEVIELIERR